MTLRRYVVCPLRPAIAAIVWLSVIASYNVTAAQVGHDPGHSPYRDVRRGAAWVLTFGNLGGSRGSVGVGLSSGKTGGIRYEPSFGAIGASLGLAYGRTDRYVVDPTQDSLSPQRKTGPFLNDVVLADAGLQLVLTGRKTWRGFAPYVGGALGVAISGSSPPDLDGDQFGTEVMPAPNTRVPGDSPRRPFLPAQFPPVPSALN